MKKILFSLAAAALLVSCGNSNKYSVTMTLPNSDLAGQTVYLRNYDTEDTVASAVVADSIVKFEGSVEKDFLASMDGRTVFVVEPGEIIVKDGEASGTKLNDALASLSGTVKSIIDTANGIMMDVHSGAIDSAACANAMDSLNNVYLEAFKSVYEANKDNSLGILAFTGYVQNEEMTLDEIEAELATAPVVAQSKQVGKIIDVLRKEEMTAEGAMFTDFTVTDADGKEQKLSDYVGKGDYVLADFWASWCGPCRAEIPNIKKIYEKYKGKGLTVLGIAVWDKPEDTKKAIDELKISWQQITNAGQVPTDLYGIQGIPHIILFGPDGKIIARDLRGEEMIAKVDEVMKKK